MSSIRLFKIKRQVSAGGTDTSGSKRPRIEDRHGIQDWTSRSVIQGNHTHVEQCLYKNDNDIDNDLDMLGPETAQCDTCFGEVGAARHPAVIYMLTAVRSSVQQPPPSRGKVVKARPE
jgi:hypothetical protein